MLGPDDLKQAEAQEEKVEVGKKEQTKLEPTPGIDTHELDMLNVGRALGMETLDIVKKNGLRLEALMEWSRAKGASDQLGMIAELKHLMHRLGSRSIHDLYVYTRLDIDRMATENKMRKMERL